MRKIFLMLLTCGLCALQPKLVAEETPLAPNANFEPARPTAPESTTAPPGKTGTPAVQRAGGQTNQAVAAKPGISPPSSEVEEASREEITRRQEAQMMAQTLIEQGLKLYSDAKYEAAITPLEQAIKILPRAKATETDYSRAARGLTDSYCRLAEAALQAGDNVKAKQLAQKSLEYDPKNRSAENTIVKAEKAKENLTKPASKTGETAVALDQSPEFVAKKDEIKKLFREGRILLNSGQYDEAEKRARQILLIDRYNEDASTLLQRINDARLEFANDASDKARSQLLWQVTDEWVQKAGSEVKLPALGAGGQLVGAGLKEAGIKKKLDEIIFPEISFREAVISDVVNFLSDESRKLDPDKVGVNIVLGGGAGELAPSPSPALGTAPSAPSPPPISEAENPNAGARPSTSVAPAPGAPVPPTPGGAKITLNLRNVPMIEALRYITTLANLDYRIEKSAVLVLPLGAPTAAMTTRTYPVTPGVFATRAAPVSALTTGGLANAQFGAGAATTANAARQSTGGGGGGGAASGFLALETTQVGILITPTTDDVRSFFVNAGVQFPTNSTLVYDARSSTIIVKNTPENLEAFETVLAAINVIPKQVEIEAKFVDIEQNNLNELGFQWNVSGRQFGSFGVAGGGPSTPFGVENTAPTSVNNVTSGLRDSTALQGDAIASLLGQGQSTSPDQIANVAGILTNPQFQLVIKALSQKTGTDLLSSPKVTTVSGHQAQIRIADEFIYPTTYTPPTATAAAGGINGSAGAVAITPSLPSGFTTREVGVLLNVIATVGADGYTISLSLIPEVSEFLGFIEYGANEALSAGTSVVNVFNSIKQPLFSTRSCATSIQIWDGQTVVLGGLIKETVQTIDDKVPFLGDIPMLGRLFQSKVTSRDKRNLLIFVTVRLIDPSGNPVHRQDTAAVQ
jgi:general secretion pathway protein D